MAKTPPTPYVETPTVRLQRLLANSEYHNLDVEIRTKFALDYVRNDWTMRHNGQKKIVWDGNVTEAEVMDQEVVVQTEKGEQVGKAIYFGSVQDFDGVFRRTVIVKVPSSGSVFEAPGRCVRLATDDDKQRMRDEVKMASRLEKANGLVEESTKERRAKRVVGSHLVESMLSVAKSMPSLMFSETGEFHKIVGPTKGKVVYLSRKGGRVDLSGFCVDHEAIIPISEEQARARHIGKVRGQFDFERSDEAILAAWRKVLEEIK